MNLRVPWKAWNFLIGWETQKEISLLHVVSCYFVYHLKDLMYLSCNIARPPVYLKSETKPALAGFLWVPLIYPAMYHISMPILPSLCIVNSQSSLPLVRSRPARRSATCYHWRVTSTWSYRAAPRSLCAPFKIRVTTFPSWVTLRAYATCMWTTKQTFPRLWK